MQNSPRIILKLALLSMICCFGSPLFGQMGGSSLPVDGSPVGFDPPGDTLESVIAPPGQYFLFQDVDCWHGSMPQCPMVAPYLTDICLTTESQSGLCGSAFPACPYAVGAPDLSCTGSRFPISYSGEAWKDTCEFQDRVPAEMQLTKLNMVLHNKLNMIPWSNLIDTNLFKFYINGILYQSVTAPNLGTTAGGKDDYWCNSYCMDEVTYGAGAWPERWWLCNENNNAGAAFGYRYNPDNDPSIAPNVFKVAWTKRTADSFCIDHLQLNMLVRYLPLVKYIQAIGPQEDSVAGTQLLSDYQNLTDGAQIYSNVLYKTVLNTNKTAQVQDLKELSPVVVPYSPGGLLSRKFKLRMIMYGAGTSTDSDYIKTYYSYTMHGKGGTSATMQQTTPQTGRQFEIEMDSPSEIGIYYLKLTFEFKYLDPDFPGSETALGSQTITVPLYSILGFSKPLDNQDPPTLPSKCLLAQALEYNKGAKTTAKSKENILLGVYNDNKHYYDPGSSIYISTPFNACDLLVLNYGDYIRDINDDSIYLIRLNCAATSNLAAVLSRSLGVPFDFYGIRSKITGDYLTQSILTFGHSRTDWHQYSFNWHQLNFSGYYFDAVMKYLDDSDQYRDKNVISLTWDQYTHYVFTDVIMVDRLCSPSSAGIDRVAY